MTWRRVLLPVGAVMSAVAIVAFWSLADAMQRTATVQVINGALVIGRRDVPLGEHLLIAGQVLAVVVALRWPVPAALLGGSCLALTAVAGYQGSLALGLLPVVVRIAAARGSAREAVAAAGLVLSCWLWFILAVPGPNPAVSEYFGVVLGSFVPLVLVLGARQIRASRSRRAA